LYLRLLSVSCCYTFFTSIGWSQWQSLICVGQFHQQTLYPIANSCIWYNKLGQLTCWLNLSAEVRHVLHNQAGHCGLATTQWILSIGMSNLLDTGCCLPYSGVGLQIPDPDFGKIRRLRGPIFSINNFSSILHIWVMSNGTTTIIIHLSSINNKSNSK